MVFIAAAIVSQEFTNAITEPLFAEALEVAQGLDKEFEKTGKVVGLREFGLIGFGDDRWS